MIFHPVVFYYSSQITICSVENTRNIRNDIYYMFCNCQEETVFQFPTYNYKFKVSDKDSWLEHKIISKFVMTTAEYRQMSSFLMKTLNILVQHLLVHIQLRERQINACNVQV